jgi:hypothetical protein
MTPMFKRREPSNAANGRRAIHGRGVRKQRVLSRPSES